MPPTTTIPKPNQVVIVTVAVICILLVFLRFFGYGHVAFSLPASATVWINDHKVSAQKIRLRPGTYDITIRSPRYFSTHQKVSVSYFQTTTYKPDLTRRPLSAIVTAAMGASGLYGKPDMVSEQWFINDTWLVGMVGPGSAIPTALHYQDNEWRVGYSDNGGYPHNVTNLPGSVANAVNTLEKRNAKQ